MKKILLALLLSANLSAFADDTNYPCINCCVKAMNGYSAEAKSNNLPDLAKWFDEFGSLSGTQISCTYGNCIATFQGGCSLLIDKDTKQYAWPIMQKKLDAQIKRLQARQSSLYPTAGLHCHYYSDTGGVPINYSQCL